MHRVGQLRVDRAYDVLPHPLGDERDDRREQQRQDVEALVQGRERRRVTVPEPAPRPADVPVGQVVDVGGEQPAGPLRVERLERGVTSQHQPVHLGQRPPVERRPVGEVGHRRRVRHPVVRVARRA